MSDVKDSLFLKSLRGEPCDRTPIWIMRQAGRYLPEYLAVRKKLSFTELCHSPEAACEVTMQPIRRFGFDAAILFSDILTPLGPMGAKFGFPEGGPYLEKPLRTDADIAELRTFDSRDETSFVAEEIKLIKSELGPTTPLIGFAGSPFTLATYLIEGSGSKDFQQMKTVLYSRPDLLCTLLDKLTDQISDYLAMQIEAGVDAVQLFDTWGGLLHPRDYKQYVLPRVHRLLDSLGRFGVPRIYFLKGSAPFLDLIKTLPVEAQGLDWTLGLQRTASLLPDVTLQGNLDPTALFGNPTQLRERALRICREGEAARGHVFNLGHGILPNAPIAAVENLVETVQGYRKGQ